MDSKEIEKRRLTLDDHMHLTKDGVEFWYAREVMEVFGYTQWRNFEETIKRAMISLESSKTPVSDHFADIGKMVPLGSGAERLVKDYMLTRYACYLIAQNGDPPQGGNCICPELLRPSNAQARAHRAAHVGAAQAHGERCPYGVREGARRHSLRVRCGSAGVRDHQIKRGRGSVRRKQHEGHEKATWCAREEAPCRCPSRRDHGSQEPREFNDVTQHRVKGSARCEANRRRASPEQSERARHSRDARHQAGRFAAGGGCEEAEAQGGGRRAKAQARRARVRAGAPGPIGIDPFCHFERRRVVAFCCHFEQANGMPSPCHFERSRRRRRSREIPRQLSADIRDASKSHTDTKFVAQQNRENSM